MNVFKKNHLVLAVLISMLLSACTDKKTTSKQTTQLTTKSHKNSQQHQRPMVSSKQPSKFVLQQDNEKFWSEDFRVWFLMNEQDKPYSYTQFLKKNHEHLPYLHQFFRGARDWQRCVSSPYSLPYYELWQNILPTLDVLDELQKRGIVRHFEITSVYRDPYLNECVGGAKRSKHVMNSAIDFRLVGEQSGDFARIDFERDICEFWVKEGVKYQLGLGVYRSGAIHIDTQGYRTWGHDYSWRTSICANYGLSDVLPELQPITISDVETQRHIH